MLTSNGTFVRATAGSVTVAAPAWDNAMKLAANGQRMRILMFSFLSDLGAQAGCRLA